MKQFSCFPAVKQFFVGIKITLEIGHCCKITSVRYSTDIHLFTGFVECICQCIYGRQLASFIDQIQEDLFFHYIGVHENISVFYISMVWFQRQHTFLFVQIQHLAVQEMIFCIVHILIHQCDIRTGFDMVLQKFFVIRSINHIAWYDNHVLFTHLLNGIQIFHISCQIRTVNTIFVSVFTEQKI